MYASDWAGLFGFGSLSRSCRQKVLILELLRCIAVLHADWYWTAAGFQGDLT